MDRKRYRRSRPAANNNNSVRQMQPAGLRQSKEVRLAPQDRCVENIDFGAAAAGAPCGIPASYVVQRCGDTLSVRKACDCCCHEGSCSLMITVISQGR